MPNHALFFPVRHTHSSAPLQDQIQMAMALADAAILKSLLCQCIPPITQPHLIANLTVKLSVTLADRQIADGILAFDRIHCVPAQTLAQPFPDRPWGCENSQHHRYTQCQSGIQTLGQGLSLYQCEQLLGAAGYTAQQVREILHLPYDAWHKSWWYRCDREGQFTIPFLRMIRTRHYSDGKYNLQYRDAFELEQPDCFHSHPQRVLIAIKSEGQGFKKTLDRVNSHRHSSGIEQVVLICNTLSELEAQSLMRQGINLYPAQEVVVPLQSDCGQCQRYGCAMQGTIDSPVVLCYGFQPESLPQT